MDALVLGSGVIGLTTALRLQEAGLRTGVWAAAPWQETVSATAAAIWYPFRAYPAELVEAWSWRSLEVYAALAGAPGTGVRMVEGRVLWRGVARERELAAVPPPARDIPAAELPEGYAGGAVAVVPIVEMPRFLPWLEERFRAGGGEVRLRRVSSLEPALDAAPVVVNCTGLGARELAGDPSIYPIQGQIVRVENPGLDRFTLDAEGHGEEITYVIPRAADVVLGGTAVQGRAETAPVQETTDRILARCMALEPSLRGAKILEQRVGLRPGRPAVRLEMERHGDRAVIHNYGHGGSGVTVCWGCAEEVARLACER